ncbi:MAG: hypothetical protein LBU82_04015 [Treponema sp.]|jgi:hypothetical protein|nr:hypothetical protein [Treponema sp.]
MAKRKLTLEMLIMALLGMAVLGACVSTPSEPVLPDSKTAVVYFFGYRSDEATVWDSLTPIGDFSEGPRIGNIAYKTTPGEHYFLANTFNWATLRANLKANKTYYVRLAWIPNPVPYAKNFVAFDVLNQEDGESWFNKSRTGEFSNEWRADFAKDNKDLVEEAKKELNEAKKDKALEVRLK